MEYFEEKNLGYNPSRPGVYSCDKIAFLELNPNMRMMVKPVRSCDLMMYATVPSLLKSMH